MVHQPGSCSIAGNDEPWKGIVASHGAGGLENAQKASARGFATVYGHCSLRSVAELRTTLFKSSLPFRSHSALWCGWSIQLIHIHPADFRVYTGIR